MHVLLVAIVVLLLAITQANPRSALVLYALVSVLARLGFLLVATLIGGLLAIALISGVFATR